MMVTLLTLLSDAVGLAVQVEDSAGPAIGESRAGRQFEDREGAGA